MNRRDLVIEECWERWLQKGRNHRDGGRPAAIKPNGKQEFWVEGENTHSLVPKGVPDWA